MSWLKKILKAVCYVATGGAPLLAATGVGTPAAVALGAVGLAAAAALHFADNPSDAKAAAELGTTVRGVIEAAKAVKK